VPKRGGAGEMVQQERTHTLTPREKEILRILASGATEKEAARRLQLSLRTVEGDVSNALRKLGCRSHFAAGIVASRGGIV